MQHNLSAQKVIDEFPPVQVFQKMQIGSTAEFSNSICTNEFGSSAIVSMHVNTEIDFFR